ncbi:DUF6443 domain-containing protein [Paenimyroides baculatum]|uniref:DUF6443 domain-containing protein n=1 Tax=Paenimyroides baculatum TaxID=2608000 RepID=A0A5M6CKR4_9FLAO|nr:DUF6443 domain-containing protein [Paenimyroides baculatum]KAA5535616.1 hypothetical protein F0460_07495 [Paenimyroides baculatum]
MNTVMNNFRIILTNLFVLLPFVLIAQTEKNFIVEKNYLKAKNSTSSNSSDFNTNISYFDGLGRKIQQIETDEYNNLVTNYEYDENNAILKEYLPHTAPSDNIEYVSNFNQILQSEYNFSNPYNKNRYEKANYKLLEQGFPGEAWNMDKTLSHTLKNEYHFNTVNEVKKYVVTNSISSLIVTNEISVSGFYSGNVLRKEIQKNENWTPQDQKNNTTELFFNEYNSIVLSRVFSNNLIHDTYYVYNDANKIVAVLPPMSEGDVSPVSLEKWCYLYNYDNQGRLVEKKLPQKEWEYLVYDKKGRVVMAGPVYNPFGDGTRGWLVSKYDVLGRVIYTGFYPANIFSRVERNSLAANNFTAESKSATNNIIDGITTRYTNTSFPTNIKLLTLNYYDDYNYPNAPTSFPIILGQQVNTMVKGQQTGTWNRILTTPQSIAGNLSYNFYDAKYRVIRNYAQNHLGGYTQIDTQLNFTGTPAKTVTSQKQNNSAALLTVANEYTYDRRNRLIGQTQQIGSGQFENIVLNAYDSYGRLNNKKVGGTVSVPLQDIGYRYNSRGWLTSVNTVQNLGLGSAGDKYGLFNYAIAYDGVFNGDTSKPQYNGNISSVIWRTESDNIIRGYGYDYDHLNRLNYASQLQAVGSYFINYYRDGQFAEDLTYDKNGNILSLKRYGMVDIDQPDKIDDLTYLYEGNQLQSVTDSSSPTTSIGFQDGNKVGDDYIYDTLGNIITDKNKSISSISYNHLNLPYQVAFSNGGNIKFTYDSSGIRLSKKVQPNGGALITTDYMNGFQYENGTLQFFPHTEGYVKRNTDNTYLYVYQYKDHLGNIRLSYGDVDGNGIVDPVNEILEENNYYPFGLKHKGYNEVVNSKRSEAAEKYKFQEQERNEELGLNWDSFKWRNYDYTIGRFMNIDPLSEKYNYQSHYNFSENRVVDGRELEGLEWASIHNEDGTTTLQLTIQLYNDAELSKRQLETFKDNISKSFSETYAKHGYSAELIINDTSEPKGDMLVYAIDNRDTKVNEKEGTIEYKGGYATSFNTQKNMFAVSAKINGKMQSKDRYTRTFNHEAGHTGGLQHPWDPSNPVDAILQGGANKVSKERTDLIKNNLMNSDANPIDSYKPARGSDLLLQQLDLINNNILWQTKK